MKLSVVTATYRERFGEEVALRMISEAGFDAVDFSLCDTSDRTYMLGDDYIERAEITKERLQMFGLACNQAHAPFKLLYNEAFDTSVKNYRDVVRSIEYASILGAKGIVVHAIKVPDDADFVEYNLAYYKSLEPYAKKYGIKIAVENLLNSIFWTPYKLCHFIKMLNSDVFCACVDVGHSAIIGMPPEDFIAGMDKSVMKYVHLHDTDFKLDRHWIPYEGLHNWDNITKALAEYNFDGDIELEVIHCFDHVDDELMFPMLVYIEKVGRLLIKKFNEHRNNL